MANTYKNITITPNRDTLGNIQPVLRFSGGDAASNVDMNVRIYTTSNGTLSFEGTAGQLFSITNDLSNVIFSVNDISGIPSLEIDANGKITLAQYSGNVGIGNANAIHKLDVAGGANISSYLIVAGTNVSASVLAIVPAYNKANTANITADLAFNHANNAYAKANGALANSTGTFAGTLSVTEKLIALAVGGDEGGEILLDKPPSGILDGGITIDAFKDKIRIFEQGGAARGVYINLASAAAGVGTDLLNPGATPDTVARTTASAAYDKANSANITADLSFNHANAAYFQANVATANVILAFDKANIAHVAFTHANNAYAKANSANITADLAFNHANAAFLEANTVGIETAAAFLKANTANITADLAFTKANAANTLASTVAINYVIDGAGGAITVGQKGYLEVPFNCRLDTWSIYLDQTGSIQIEVWADTYANFPPTAADTINATPYTVTTAVKAQGTVNPTLANITAGETLAFNVVTASTTTRATIALKATKT